MTSDEVIHHLKMITMEICFIKNKVLIGLDPSLGVDIFVKLRLLIDLSTVYQCT